MVKTKADWLLFYKHLASQMGGVCLSDEYQSSSQKLMWRCSEGHEWSAIPQNVKKGHWCGICGNVRQGVKKSKGIESAKRLAEKRSGKCLSDTYKNNREDLHWECALGHQWFASAHSVTSGSWCPVCVGKLPPQEALKQLQTIANSKGGLCVSTAYKNAKFKLLWRCSDGHEWKAAPSSIRNGTWCPECAGTVSLTLDVMKETAAKFGGECLSDEYINSNEKLKWRCAEGHEWEAVAYHVRSGHWCPICSAGSSERICRDVFEQLFQEQFPKARPNWLLNAKGNRMELDGYCSGLNLAFEYHGIQHYQEQKFFHRTGSSLAERVADDKQKRELCEANGVELIEIPYDIPLTSLPTYIQRNLSEELKSRILLQPIEIEVARFVLPEKIREMQAVAAERDGECLSDTYINNNSRLWWRCAVGHEWEAIPSSVKSGTWCPECAGRVGPEKALAELKSIAKKHNGLCLSKDYLGVKTKHQWQCAEGHIWEATPDSIRNKGTWCPDCAVKIKGPARLGLEICKNVAVGRGGECLSDEYKNTDTKLRWRCAEGHEWDARPDSVVRIGTWCPKCKGKLAWATRRANSNS